MKVQEVLKKGDGRGLIHVSMEDGRTAYVTENPEIVKAWELYQADKSLLEAERAVKTRKRHIPSEVDRTMMDI